MKLYVVVCQDEQNKGLGFLARSHDGAYAAFSGEIGWDAVIFHRPYIAQAWLDELKHRIAKKSKVVEIEIPDEE